MKWYARMIYPYKKEGNSNGHYDLQLVGNYFIDGDEYTNPIFSYQGDENNVGHLLIFDRSITTAVYKKHLPFKGYHYNGTTSSTDAEYDALWEYLNEHVDWEQRSVKKVYNKAGNYVGTATRYELKSSYKSYYAPKRNCFKALGYWVNALGDDRFKKFAEKHNYKDYIAHAMVNNYSSLWDLQGTYTE